MSGKLQEFEWDHTGIIEFIFEALRCVELRSPCWVGTAAEFLHAKVDQAGWIT